MKRIEIFGNARCAWCIRAKDFCENENLPYDWLDTDDEEMLATLREFIPGVKQIPQIFIDGVHVGGYTEFVEEMKKK